MSTVTVNGNTYTEPDDFQGTAYKSVILALATDLLADVSRALTTTSTTSVAVGTGSKAFTMEAAVPFGVGAYVVVADAAAPTTNLMWGQVTSRSGTALVVSVAVSAGSGTLSDWVITISGARGEAGTLAGNASGAIDMNGYAITLDGVTLSAAVAGADQQVSRVELRDIAETYENTASSGAAKTLDCEVGNNFTITLTANCTFTFSNPAASGKLGAMTVVITQGGSGSYTITWPGSVIWPGGNAPAITSAVSSKDAFAFLTFDGGTTWFGFIAGQDFS